MPQTIRGDRLLLFVAICRALASTKRRQTTQANDRISIPRDATLLVRRRFTLTSVVRIPIILTTTADEIRDDLRACGSVIEFDLGQIKESVPGRLHTLLDAIANGQLTEHDLGIEEIV
jgi:hypothetical protein